MTILVPPPRSTEAALTFGINRDKKAGVRIELTDTCFADNHLCQSVIRPKIADDGGTPNDSLGRVLVATGHLSTTHKMNFDL